MARRRDVDRLQGEIEELFSDLWQVPRFTGSRRGFRPAADCFRTADPPRLTVVLELPGVRRDEIELTATAQALVVRGERRRPRAPGRVYQQVEIEYGPFERRIQLADDVDVSRATASYDAGLLTIVIPVADRPPLPVGVPIEVEPES